MVQDQDVMGSNLRMLGDFLGETIKDAQGSEILDLIENIRQRI